MALPVCMFLGVEVELGLDVEKAGKHFGILVVDVPLGYLVPGGDGERLPGYLFFNYRIDPFFFKESVVINHLFDAEIAVLGVNLPEGVHGIGDFFLILLSFELVGTPAVFEPLQPIEVFEVILLVDFELAFLFLDAWAMIHN